MLRLLRTIQKPLILIGLLPKQPWDPPIRIHVSSDSPYDFQKGEIWTIYRTDYRVVKVTPKHSVLEVVVEK
jgi:hypothetical protein